MAKIHDPIIQHMQQLPCQQSHTVLWWKQQSIQRWRTDKNYVQKNPTFVPESVNSINDQPNVNVPNAKLKYIYNVEKSAWMLKYGMKRFSPHHINSVLVEAWDAFKMSTDNIIRNSFTKTYLPPPQPYQLNNK